MENSEDSPKKARKPITQRSLKMTSKKMIELLAERTGLPEKLVKDVVGEYELTVQEMLFIQRKPVVVFGLFLVSLGDRGEGYRTPLGFVIPRYVLHIRRTPLLRNLLHRLGGTTPMKGMRPYANKENLK